MPSEVWLRAEIDNRAFYPDESGHFNLQEMSLLIGSVLSVEGPNLPPGAAPSVTVSSTAQSSGIGASASYNSTPLPPKLLVITKSNRKGKSRKRNHNVMYDSDAEEQPNQKKSKDKSSLKTIESKVDDMKEDIESIKETIQDIWHLNETSKVPMGLQRIIRDAFQCKISFQSDP